VRFAIGERNRARARGAFALKFIGRSGAPINVILCERARYRCIAKYQLGRSVIFCANGTSKLADRKVARSCVTLAVELRRKGREKKWKLRAILQQLWHLATFNSEFRERERERKRERECRISKTNAIAQKSGNF